MAGKFNCSCLGLHLVDSAKAMHCRSMRLIQNELTSQVLPDGGHEERSGSYHLLMLDRLVELACSLSTIKGERPLGWFPLLTMVAWTRAVRLEGGRSPRFNDSRGFGATSGSCHRVC